MHRVPVTTSVCFSPTSWDGRSGAGLGPASHDHELAREGCSHRPRQVSRPVQTIHRDGGVIRHATGRAPIKTAGCWEQRGGPRGSHPVSPASVRSGSCERLRCAS